MALDKLAGGVQGIVSVIRWVLDAFVWVLKFLIAVLMFLLKAIPWVIGIAIILAAFYFAYQFALWMGKKMAKKPKPIPYPCSDCANYTTIKECIDCDFYIK